ncbi:MAG: DUF2023 family protein [Candidatus Cloacimonetes bacterium]|nr:DUF2023 family protein [Candidatus Cloacimonadota bacterium]
MKLFTNYLYEYKKGLRNLAIYTGRVEEKDAIIKKLMRENITYYIQKLNNTRINVFFGDKICIDIIRQMNLKSLSNLTEEEDFILGIMLGYNRLKQCERYLKRKHHNSELLSNTIQKKMDVQRI